MQAIEARQLISYDVAMQLAKTSRRTLYRRLSNGQIPIYIDAADRRRRLLDRRDVERLLRQEQESERSGEVAA